MKKNFLEFDNDFWKFIRNWNIGLIAFYVIGLLFPNQGMSGKDTFLYFFMLNAPPWSMLLFGLFSKSKK